MSKFEDLWTGKSIGTALEEAAERFGSKQAIIFDREAVSFTKLHEMSGVVALGLLARGVKKGDRVAIWMAGYPEWAYIYYACARIGAIMIPVNTRYKPFELEYILKKSRAKVLIFKDERRKGKDYFSIISEICPELGSDAPCQLTSRRLSHLACVVVVNGERSGCLTFKELVEAGETLAPDTLKAAEGRVTSEDDALIQFTSGTTALPKGAVLFNNAMLRASYYNSYFLGVTEKDLFFSPQPFYHVGGSIQVMLGPVVLGCTMVVQSYFDSTEALALMEEHQCTVTMGHQPHWIEYLDNADLKKFNLNLERAEIFAPPDLRRRVSREMGIDILISPYSMTENHIGGCICNSNDPPEKRLTTVGRAMPGIEVVAKDPKKGKALPPGEVGELCFRGWSIMRGYDDDPERTAEVIDRNGWLRTGDLGTVDPEGYVRLVGRIKDMIRVGGENVAASDVEDFLLRNEKVKQAIAVGAPDKRLGEMVVAFVELKFGVRAVEEELISYCRSGLASFKVPRQIRFVNEWPMSGTGKIQKSVLQSIVNDEFGGKQ